MAAGAWQMSTPGRDGCTAAGSAGVSFRFPMKLTYSELSSPGPRPVNEDSLGSWEDEVSDELLTRGFIAALADGVGGHGDGEIASQLAVETALRTFREANPSATDKQLLWRIF